MPKDEKDEFDIIDKQDEPGISNKIEIYDPHKSLSDFYKYNKNCVWLWVSMIFVDLLVLFPLLSLLIEPIMKLLDYLFRNINYTVGDNIVFYYLAIVAIRIILLITSIVLKIKKIISKKCLLILLVLWSIPLISALLFFGWCFYEFRNF